MCYDKKMVGKSNTNSTSNDSDEKKGAKILSLAKSAITRSVELALTEETLRMVQDLKKPKEVMSLLADQAEKGKDEVMKIITQEISKMFAKVDLKKEMLTFFEDYQINLHVTITPRKKTRRKKRKVKPKT